MNLTLHVNPLLNHKRCWHEYRDDSRVRSYGAHSRLIMSAVSAEEAPVRWIFVPENSAGAVRNMFCRVDMIVMF